MRNLPPYRDTFDIDDTLGAAHGNQQLTFWNAQHDERGFQPMHVCHAGSGHPVATIPRAAKTPNGREVRTVIKHLTMRIRHARAWRDARIVRRGDSHYSRIEAMDWCEDNDRDYISGFLGNAVLDREVAEISVQLRFWHALSDAPRSRLNTSCFKHGAPNMHSAQMPSSCLLHLHGCRNIRNV